MEPKTIIWKMLSLNKKSMRLPFGGHHFPEPGITIKADTFEQVIKLLSDYRIVNGKPVGSPEQDVILYYSINFPWMVVDDHAGDPVPVTPGDYEAWRKWIVSTWQSPPISYLTTKEATDRWDKCSKCPMNKPRDWRPSPELTALMGRAYLLRQGVSVPETMGYCAYHRWDVGAASFLVSPAKFSNKPEGEAQPENCWVFDGSS